LPETIWEQLRSASGELGKVAALFLRAAALGEMTGHLKLGGYELRAESPRGSEASAPRLSILKWCAVRITREMLVKTHDSAP